MNQIKSFFKRRRAQKNIESFKRTCSQSTIDTQDSACDDDEIPSLTRRMRDLESRIKASGIEAQLREERLQNEIIIHEQNVQKLQIEPTRSKFVKTSIERELIHASLDKKIAQLNALSFTKHVEESTQTLCNVISSDRLWIEEQMSRRALSRNNIIR